MPKKCESCRFLMMLERDDFDNAICMSVDINSHDSVKFRRVPTMTEAREICDKEGDGIFVYYEEKRTWKDCPDCGHTVFSNETHECQTPKGAAFASPVQQFVQINREVREGLKTAAAGGAQ